MSSKEVKDAIESAIDGFIEQGAPEIFSGLKFLKTSSYVGVRQFPQSVDEFISARFPGSVILRDEIGGTAEDRSTGENLYTEDAAFRVDCFVRVNARQGPGSFAGSTVTRQDRLYELMEGVKSAFLGKTFEGVEIFGVQNGMGTPDDAPNGWWGDSLSFQYHFEHFGP